MLKSKLRTENWGQKTVEALADFLKTQYPDLKGFGRRGLYRMRQFYETYPGEIVSPAVTQLPWTQNLLIMSQSKSAEERDFYLKACTKEKWSKRELEHLLKNALTSRIDDREVYLKGIDVSYYYEGYTTFKTDEL